MKRINIQGRSKKQYSFDIYPTSHKYSSNIGGVYMYAELVGRKEKSFDIFLLSCESTNDLAKIFEEDKDIDYILVLEESSEIERNYIKNDISLAISFKKDEE